MTSSDAVSSTSSISAFHYDELARATFAGNNAAKIMAETMCKRLARAEADSRARMATLRAMRRVAEGSSRRFRIRLRELDEHLRAAEMAGGGQEMGAMGKVDQETRAMARVGVEQNWVQNSILIVFWFLVKNGILDQSLFVTFYTRCFTETFTSAV